MANLNIKLNAYFSPKIPKHMIKIDNVSSEALWFCSHDVLEYIKSLGVKKDSYIGLIGGNHLYIKPDGTLDGYGIKITDVETKMLDLPAENKTAVYNRMISERNNIAASFTAQGNQKAQEIMNNTSEQVTVILAKAQKQADTLVAEGEAEYMRILSAAYNDHDRAEFYRFVRQLDAVEATLKTGTNKIVLDKTSPIAEIFY